MTTRKNLYTACILIILLIIASIWAMMLGDYHMSAGQVIGALLGSSADPMAAFFVQDLRAPRVIMAIGVGAALGLAGCIFQEVTRNPLGSPDITGFTVGAATGALVQIVVFNGGVYAIAVAAVIGGFLSGLAVHFLAGNSSGTRFVLIGIGFSAILSGINSLLIVRASLQAAQTAAIWMSGSLNATTWPQVIALLIALAIVIPAALLLARPLVIMGLGDDMAQGLGVPVVLRRKQLLALGVILVACAVASAGPISFVALAAPHIIRTMTRNAGMVNSALMGAVIVLLSDIAAQRLFAPTQLPVGVITGVLGGVYLLFLLGARRA